MELVYQKVRGRRQISCLLGNALTHLQRNDKLLPSNTILKGGTKNESQIIIHPKSFERASQR